MEKNESSEERKWINHLVYLHFLRFVYQSMCNSSLHLYYFSQSFGSKIVSPSCRLIDS
jgi:hypothetical protein